MNRAVPHDPASSAASDASDRAPASDSEVQLRAVLDNTSAAVFLIDAGQRCTFMNAAAEAMTGYTLAEAAGKQFHDIVRHIRTDGAVDRAVPEGRRTQGEEVFVHKNGSLYPVAFTASPVEDASARIVGTVIEVRSIAADKAAEANLRASEAALARRTRELERIAFAAPAAIYINDRAARRTTFTNPGATDILGYSPEEIHSAPPGALLDLLHPADVGIVEDMLKRAEAAPDGEAVEAEYRMRRKDGKYVWLFDRVVVLERDARGAVAQTLGVSIDVTERRAANNRLRDRAEQLRLVQAAGGIGSFDWDMVTGKVYRSPEYLAIHGFDSGAPEAVNFSETWLDRIYPEDRDAVERWFKDDVAACASFDREYRIVRPSDGAVCWIVNRGRVIGDENGRAIRLLSAQIDVTERRLEQEALAASEARFRELFDNANDFIFTADRDLLVTSCNPAVAAALGAVPAELIGRSLREFVAPEAFERNREIVVAMLGTAESARVELDVLGRDGPMTWDINCRLTRDIGGRPTGLQAIARDVTERNRMEAQQRLLIDELNHRVKNTLAIVQAIAQQTLRGTDGAEREAFAGRLSALAAAHGLLSRRYWVAADLREVATEALRAVAGVGRVALEGPPVRLPPKTAVTLSLTLHELCTNAFKFGGLSVPGGSVALSWEVTAGETPRLVIHWRERGGPRVVSPEQRGFGLRMIERALAAELGGRSEIRFEPGGVVFDADVSLPRVAESVAQAVPA